MESRYWSRWETGKEKAEKKAAVDFLRHLSSSPPSEQPPERLGTHLRNPASWGVSDLFECVANTVQSVSGIFLTKQEKEIDTIKEKEEKTAKEVNITKLDIEELKDKIINDAHEFINEYKSIKNVYNKIIHAIHIYHTNKSIIEINHKGGNIAREKLERMQEQIDQSLEKIGKLLEDKDFRQQDFGQFADEKIENLRSKAASVEGAGQRVGPYYEALGAYMSTYAKEAEVFARVLSGEHNQSLQQLQGNLEKASKQIYQQLVKAVKDDYEKAEHYCQSYEENIPDEEGRKLFEYFKGRLTDFKKELVEKEEYLINNKEAKDLSKEYEKLKRYGEEVFKKFERLKRHLEARPQLQEKIVVAQEKYDQALIYYKELKAEAHQHGITDTDMKRIKGNIDMANKYLKEKTGTMKDLLETWKKLQADDEELNASLQKCERNPGIKEKEVAERYLKAAIAISERNRDNIIKYLKIHAKEVKHLAKTITETGFETGLAIRYQAFDKGFLELCKYISQSKQDYLGKYRINSNELNYMYDNMIELNKYVSWEFERFKNDVTRSELQSAVKAVTRRLEARSTYGYSQDEIEKLTGHVEQANERLATEEASTEKLSESLQKLTQGDKKFQDYTHAQAKLKQQLVTAEKTLEILDRISKQTPLQMLALPSVRVLYSIHCGRDRKALQEGEMTTEELAKRSEALENLLESTKLLVAKGILQKYKDTKSTYDRVNDYCNKERTTIGSKIGQENLDSIHNIFEEFKNKLENDERMKNLTQGSVDLEGTLGTMEQLIQAGTLLSEFSSNEHYNFMAPIAYLEEHQGRELASDQANALEILMKEVHDLEAAGKKLRDLDTLKFRLESVPSLVTEDAKSRLQRKVLNAKGTLEMLSHLEKGLKHSPFERVRQLYVRLSEESYKYLQQDDITITIEGLARRSEALEKVIEPIMLSITGKTPLITEKMLQKRKNIQTIYNRITSHTNLEKVKERFNIFAQILEEASRRKEDDQKSKDSAQRPKDLENVVEIMERWIQANVPYSIEEQQLITETNPESGTKHEDFEDHYNVAAAYFSKYQTMIQELTQKQPEALENLKKESQDLNSALKELYNLDILEKDLEDIAKLLEYLDTGKAIPLGQFISVVSTLNNCFHREFDDCIQKQNNCFGIDLQKKYRGKLLSIHRRSKISDIPTELKKPFAIARGKARKERVKLQEKLYAQKDKDIAEEINKGFKPTDPYESEGGWRVLSDLRVPGKDSFEHIINVDEGEIIDVDVNNLNKNINNSDMAFDHTTLILRKSRKTFKNDFIINKCISKNITNPDTLETMELFLEKEAGSDTYKEEQTFEENSDGFWAFLGTPLGSSKWFLPAEHPKALKGRKPIRVRVRINEAKIICEYE